MHASFIPSVGRLLADLVRRVRSCYTWDRYSLNSWSQEGEDLILMRCFDTQPQGFYVDVGAHHPMRFSNTWGFYRRGWRGINIDAMPGSMAAFRKKRKRDINLEIAISDEQTPLSYYIFNEPALNGFDPDLSELRDREQNDYHIIRTEILTTARLGDVLGMHLPQGQEIDFLTIDVEGLDLSVLKSNDWERYRPRLVLVEILNADMTGIPCTEAGAFLHGVGYAPFAKTFNTVFFQRQS